MSYYQENHEELSNLVNSEVGSNVGPLVNRLFDNEPELFHRFQADPRADIHEYYIVSKWLYERLEKHGEPVAQIEGQYIWGRTTTGQKKHLDAVITDIHKELQETIERAAENRLCDPGHEDWGVRYDNED